VRRWLLFALLFIAGPIYAQTTTNVTGSIVATDAQSWNNGTYQISFFPASSSPNGPYQWNGQPFNPQMFINGNLDGTGSFTQGVPSNTSITPSGSQWKFTVCPNATAPCYSKVLTVTGGTQSVTSSIIPPAIAINMANPPPSIHTYLSSELFGQITGQSYWNVTSQTLYYWNGVAWVPIGGSGGSCGSSLTPPSLLYSPTPSSCASTVFYYYPTGATGSAGFCAASSALAIPALFTQATSSGSNFDSCLTSLYFATENLTGSQISESTPLGFQTGTLSGGSIVCPFGYLIANQLELCGTFSSTNYPWTESVSAANNFMIKQLGGTGSLLIDNTGHITVSGCTGCGGLSGLTTDGLLYATSSTNATTLTPPSTNNGVYNCGYTVTANTPVVPGCAQIGLQSRAVTGTTDTIAYTDNNETVEYQGSGAVAVTLPTPTTLQNSFFFTRVENLTTGTGTAVTITPTTWTIDGGSTLVISQNQTCRIGVNPNVSTDWLSFCDPQGQYQIRICDPGIGDGANALGATTYPMLACVNKSTVSWTVLSINCYTDNAGSSTLDVKNNAGTSFLSGAITCNNTKSGGGAAGTLGSTITLAANDALNFSFVADGTSKTTTWTVVFRQ
jgi:hypothetical protein